MKMFRPLTLTAIFLAVFTFPAMAEDIEGVIESVNQGNHSLVVNGITFYASDETQYDDGLESFYDLRPGQKVEVDYYLYEGRHFATEIELDD